MHKQIQKPIKICSHLGIENSQLHLSTPLINQCNSLVSDLNIARTQMNSYNSKNVQTLTKRLNADFKKIFQSGPFG